MNLLDFKTFENEFKKITPHEYCCSCGKKLNNNNKSNKFIKPINKSIPQHCCIQCEKDVDENGFFVEEILT